MKNLVRRGFYTRVKDLQCHLGTIDQKASKIPNLLIRTSHKKICSNRFSLVRSLFFIYKFCLLVICLFPLKNYSWSDSRWWCEIEFCIFDCFVSSCTRVELCSKVDVFMGWWKNTGFQDDIFAGSTLIDMNKNYWSWWFVVVRRR